MAHAIMEHDKGYVLGSTWHKHPNYITQETPVTIDQALEVMSYPMEIFPSFRQHLVEGVPQMIEIPGAFHVVRTDHDIVLAPMIGGRYDVFPNSHLIDHVKKNVLDVYPDLSIESAGTLYNGKVAFCNIKVDKWNVEGDESSIEQRMMYYNPIGLGSYKVCSHTTRIVCNNTLRVAEKQGKENGSLVKIRHTKTAADRLSGAMDTIATERLELTTFQQQVAELARTKMTQAQAEKFFKHVFRVSEKDASARAVKKYDEVMATLESDKTIDKKTAWGVLNAFTYTVDHAEVRKTQDQMAITWDALIGDRAKLKTSVHSQLAAFIKEQVA